MRGMVWLLLLVALGGAAAQAQDEAPTSGTGAAERTAPEEGADQGVAPGQDERVPATKAPPVQPRPDSSPDAMPSPEVFVPTEDISEDLSVRFPVDI